MRRRRENRSKSNADESRDRTRGRATNDDIQNRILPRMKSAVDSIRRQIRA
jgi:hypothetical protein